MRTTLLGIFLGLLAATGACGKKGPLYLPAEKAQADAANKAVEKKDAAGKSDSAPNPAPTRAAPRSDSR